MRGRLAAVVPCYNAGGRLRPVVEQLAGMLDHVVVVDDGCTDGSLDGLEALPVSIVRFDVNRGKGHALMAGFREALAIGGVEAVAVLDADGQHDPAELPRLFAAFEREGAALAIGARVFDGAHVPWRSRFGNRVSAAIMRRVLGPGLEDTQCGYRVLSRAFAEAMLRDLPGGRYETETAMIVLAVRRGFKVVTAPIATRYEAGNPVSHFRKLRDSWRVLRVLARAAFARAGSAGPPAGR